MSIFFTSEECPSDEYFIFLCTLYVHKRKKTLLKMFNVLRLYVENHVEGVIEELECPHDILVNIMEVIKGTVIKFKEGK